ncbi:hypothetical protein OF829_14585 [Sphingomonas sp. LB-2]|uniref:hypothetical protein n=1 Tax=Sphingomonas caeni TaxID=2984949 RepID=UPI0022322AC8|nr:hypothetical protein [Sphingomonas caeni]MCW3848465.1 hypothetical protein [Sphingomonas caeni]
MSFGTPKPMASLSSSLLARKGHARPAMRPQGYVSLTPSQDDLGWNDMGEEFVQAHQPVAPVAPVAVPPSAPIEAPEPEVLRQRDVLAEQFTPQKSGQPAVQAEPEPVFTPAPAAAPAPKAIVTQGTLARVAREVSSSKSKAAFTLRLDTDRHLRLRLASAVTNRSAQQLVTEALDAFLESLTDVDTLATQLSARGGRTGS